MFDFYTVQVPVDGFGNDTWVESIWKTKEEAEKHASKNFKKEGPWGEPPFKIVGGNFGKELKLAF